ncbi:MAG: response regulator transcription factor [Chloroflexota bacterium]
MSGILIVAEKGKEPEKLAAGLSHAGYAVVFATGAETEAQISGNSPEIVLVAVTETGSFSVLDLPGRIKEMASLPVMVMVTQEALGGLSPEIPCDDFIVMPCDEKELVLRVRRLLREANGKEKGRLVCDDLVMDLAGYEVSLAGKRVELTYREYELLRFLMSNRGQVFTRETLMDRVWGYDYYGGDRTIDVHIRRLRSKIEKNGHSYIETVRNIGYRFRVGAQT